MNRNEFLRQALRYARRNGLEYYYYPDRGKGSHGRLYIGERFTTVQNGEITRPMLATMLRQLGINRRDF